MAFERDLGYLDKFFDNLEAHASTLEESSCARLRELVGEERLRWGEIRALLDGPAKEPAAAESEEQEAPEPEPKAAQPEPKEAQPEPRPGHGQSAPAPTPSADDTAPPRRDWTAGFTVGSLRSR